MVLNMHQDAIYGGVLNIPVFWVCNVAVYVSVAQGSEYA